MTAPSPAARDRVWLAATVLRRHRRTYTRHGEVYHRRPLCGPAACDVTVARADAERLGFRACRRCEAGR